MKKLLSLVLVLGMVSMAGAGLSLTTAGNVATVHSDSVDAWAALVTVSAGLGEVAELTTLGQLSLSKNENLGVMSGADLGFPELGDVTVYDVSVGGSVGEVIIPGAHYTIRLPEGIELGDTDMGLGRIDVIAYDLSGILATAYVIPEPASMLLLGLGGLFLRRK
jgi:hypothetical protein